MQIVWQSERLGKKNTQPVRRVLPWFIEYGFYASLTYAILAPILGVQIDRLSIVILTGLAILCFLGFKEWPINFFRLLAFPIGCAISYLIIQIMFYGLSINNENVKPFVPWIFTLIVVQALSFRRGFLHRFVVFALLVGIVALLFFRGFSGNEVSRIGLDRAMGPLSNPNGLGAWFGFCTVYFFVLGAGIKRQKTRIALWVIAIGCLFVVTMTVSRASLLATIVAIVLSSREFLKRGFLPVLLLVMITLIVYGVGLFDQAISFYLMRGTEETGRGLIWPKVFEGFINSPLIGVGASNVYVFLPEKAAIGAPHNSFLFFGMASGIIPLFFYTAYWIQAIRASILARIEKTMLAPFHLPLVAHSLIICTFADFAFMDVWVVVMVAGAVASRVHRGLISSRVIRSKKNGKGVSH